MIALNSKLNFQQAQVDLDFFFRLSLNMLCVVGFDGYFKRLNPHWEKILAYSNEELLNRHYIEFVHPEDIEATTLEWQKLTQGSSSTFENRYRSKNGSYKWLSWNATAVNDTQLIYLAAMDITEQKIGSESLRCLMATIEDGIVLQNSDGTIRACNAAAESTLGISQSPILGETCEDSRWLTVHSDGSPIAEEQHPLALTLETGKPCSDVIVGIHKPNDSLTWIKINTQPLFLPGETKPAVAVATFTDITERKQTEERLRLLESAVVNANDAISITEAVTPGLSSVPRMVYVNEAFTKITGFAAAEVIGKTPELLQGEKTDRAVLEEIRIQLQSWEPFKTELIFYRKDGLPFWVELNIVPLTNSNGKYTNWLWVQRDITERKSAELKVEAIARASAVVAQIGQQALAGTELKTLMNNAVTLVAQALSVEYCQLLELMPGNNAFCLRAGFGWQQGLVDYPVVGALERSQAGYTLLTKQPVIVEDLRVERRFSSAALLHNHRIISGVSVIVHGKEKPFGVLAAHSNKHRQFTEDDVNFLQGVANVLATAIERKQAEEALKVSEERYALAAKGNNEGLWDWNVKTYEVYFSSRWKGMLGYQDEEIGDSLDEWLNRVHPEDIEQVKSALDAHLQGLMSHFEKEYRILLRDGSYRWMLCRGLAVRDATGKAYRMSGSQQDITERKQSEEQLVYDAFHDALTDLPNRALFIDRLGQAIARQKRHPNYQFAVLFLDLDRFKVVNDSLGHLAGDQLLVAIARRLLLHQRSGDTVARLGGDEFVILLDDIRNVNEITRIAELLQKQVEQPLYLEGQEVCVTASIGIALSGGNQAETMYTWAGDLLRDADIAMYRAKALGKARYEVFNASMHARAVVRLQLENDLRRALEDFKLPTASPAVSQNPKFLLHYQPIICLATGKITGFEALVRLIHPERGMISPAEFIPVAEETGLIIPLGAWVLRQACQQLHLWQQTFPKLTMSVNLSGRQFSQKDLLAQIHQTLEDTGVEADSLNLEITESVVMENAEAATSMLKHLKDLGVHLSIDDFGTGYSSLSYLHRFPIDTLKIDRSFVSRMGMDGENLEIVQAIVTLAHSMQMKVVAEGVETSEQLSQLRVLKCEQGQGYFISKPLDSQTADALLAQDLHW